MKKLIAILIGTVLLLAACASSEDITEENEYTDIFPWREVLTEAEEYEEIKTLEDEIVTEVEDLLTAENKEFQDFQVDYEKASKEYVGVALAKSNTSQEDIMKFLQDAEYQWLIPVKVVTEKEEIWCKIDVGYSEHWNINFAIISQEIPYVEQLEKAKEIIDSYVILQMSTGTSCNPIALGFENGEAKYWISLSDGYDDLEELPNEQINGLEVYDYQEWQKK